MRAIAVRDDDLCLFRSVTTVDDDEIPYLGIAETAGGRLIRFTSYDPDQFEQRVILQPPHDLGRRADADVAVDERLLEPLPGLLVAGIEGARRDLGRQRTATLRE